MGAADGAAPYDRSQPPPDRRPRLHDRPDRAGPRRRRDAAGFLTTLYHRYEGKHTRGIDYADKPTLLRYFDPSLAKLITEDRAAAKKNDEVPALDGDPFVDAQEWEITRLTITVQTDGPDTAMGIVAFRNFNKPTKIQVALVRLQDGWRISDIVWPDGSLRGLYTSNR
jgi:hypothetical protein